MPAFAASPDWSISEKNMMPLSATSFLRRFTVSARGYALLTRTMPPSLSARGLAVLNSNSPAIKAPDTVAIIRVIIWILLFSAFSISAPRDDHREQDDAARWPRKRLVPVSQSPPWHCGCRAQAQREDG